MLGKCSENEGKLIWKASKSVEFLNEIFPLDEGVSFPWKIVWGSLAHLKASFSFSFWVLGRFYGKGS